jgi:hypothetical protein
MPSLLLPLMVPPPECQAAPARFNANTVVVKAGIERFEVSRS